jgi:hypothetical protein
VTSVIFVPGIALWVINNNIKTWEELDKISIQTCVNQEGAPNFNVDKCIHDAGADQTMFQHEQTTPGRYWLEALLFALVLDLVITVFLVGAFLVGRWVVRGLKS